MTFHEFENEVRDTLAKYIRDKIEIERYTELILGLYEEGGEVTSIIRRSIPGNFHETKIDIPHLEEELGDILWYISHIAMQLNSNLDRIAIANVQKIDTGNQPNYNRYCLSIKQYQQCAVRAYRNDLPKSQNEKARFFAMGMIKEIGKISELFGEYRIEQKTLDLRTIEEKLGDTLWYLSAISENYDLDLEEIAIKNIQKTKARYNKNGIAQLPKTEEGR